VTEWFEQWFGEEYLRVYPHRDDADAARLTALIAELVPLRGRLLLDLGCGPGRHAALFRERGAGVVGLDLSLPMLSRARRRGGTVPLSLVRGDMRRLPFRPGTFDVVVNLFTSFGYFTDDAQHAAVLRGAVSVLRDRGVFVLDYFSADHVRASLVPQQELRAGDMRVAVERRISADGRHVIKEIHLLDDGRSFIERVRLFSPVELSEMLGAAGLDVRPPLGDYDGSQWSESAPRVILLGDRP